jgi:hypothetical protein
MQKVHFEAKVRIPKAEPTIDTPNDEPKFETLLKKPEISLWSFPGKADCTTVTEEVNIIPIPAPSRNSPGQEVRDGRLKRPNASSNKMPMMVTKKPPRVFSLRKQILVYLHANGSFEQSIPAFFLLIPIF